MLRMCEENQSTPRGSRAGMGLRCISCFEYIYPSTNGHPKAATPEVTVQTEKNTQETENYPLIGNSFIYFRNVNNNYNSKRRVIPVLLLKCYNGNIVNFWTSFGCTTYYSPTSLIWLSVSYPKEK